jgi:hypothetical protein
MRPISTRTLKAVSGFLVGMTATELTQKTPQEVSEWLIALVSDVYDAGYRQGRADSAAERTTPHRNEDH